MPAAGAVTSATSPLHATNNSAGVNVNMSLGVPAPQYTRGKLISVLTTHSQHNEPRQSLHCPDGTPTAHDTHLSTNTLTLSR